MTHRIVVAGPTGLHMFVRVEEFPLPYSPGSTPPWLTTGVAGATGQVARVLRRLGDDVRLCTVVGHDSAGAAIWAELREHGLLGPGVINGAVSSQGVVLVGPEGRRMGFPFHRPTDDVEYPIDVFRGQAQGADVAVLTRAAFVRPLIPCADRLGVPIAVDLHLIEDLEDPDVRPWLDAARIVFCSHERLPCTVREWIARVFERCPRSMVVGVGRGARGCTVGLSDGRLVEVAAVTPRGVVNSAGAGDGLFASFLHYWLATGDAVSAVESAVLHAGWMIGHTLPTDACLAEADLAALQVIHPVTATKGRWT